MKNLNNKTLHILGKKIKIREVDLGSDYHGLYVENQNMILINKSSSEKTATLIHEMIHAIFKRASFNQAINDQLEEVIADIIANVIDENFKVTFK